MVNQGNGAFLAQRVIDARDRLAAAKAEAQEAIEELVKWAPVADTWTVYTATSGRLVGVLKREGRPDSVTIHEFQRGM